MPGRSAQSLSRKKSCEKESGGKLTRASFLTSLSGISFFLLIVHLWSCQSGEQLGDDTSPKLNLRSGYVDSLEKSFLPLYETVPAPEPGDWLYSHNEKHQSFSQYKSSRITRPDAVRRIIYIQPLGTFDSTRLKILKETADYLHSFFNLEVKILPGLSDSLVPSNERRMQDGQEQLRSMYILQKVLKPRLPSDAMIYLAFTKYDLFPSAKWNFVFGQASLSDRVGVWSLNRFGDPSRDSLSYANCLMRTFKTAAHESSHMFSIPHCRRFKCLMNGANSLAEADSRPQWLCTECLCKLSHNLDEHPERHINRMKQFWETKDSLKYCFYSDCKKKIR